MDERDFEDRLKARIDQEFGQAHPSDDLHGRVLKAMEGDTGTLRRLPSVRLTTAAAILIAVASVVGAVVVTTRLGAVGPAATPNPSGLVSSSPSATPSPSAVVTPMPVASLAASGGLTWHSVPTAQFGDVALTNIWALPDGYLGLGSSGFGTLPPVVSRPTLLRSADGLSWQPLPDSPAFSDLQNNRVDSIAGVTEGPSSLLVAVGASNNGDLSAFDAAAWTSADRGLTWQRATVAGASDAAMNSATATPHGYVAVGIDGHPSGGTQMIGSRGAAVWTSSDGSQWTRVPTDRAFAGAQMTRVIQAGSTIVAIGSDMPTGAGGIDPPIWTSPDGLSWARVSVNGSVSASLSIAGVVWTGSQFVAVGADELDTPRFIWTSSDGRIWYQAPLLLGTAGPSGFNLTDLGHVGSTLVLVGSMEAAVGGHQAVVWESIDGSNWQAIPSTTLFEHNQPIGAVSGPAGLLVLSSPDQPNLPPLWLASPSTAASAVPCRASDVAMSSGLWGPAGGSTYESYVLTLRGGSSCLLPAGPAIALLDRAGHVIVSAVDQGGATVELRTSVTVLVGWSSWCSPALSQPLSLRLTLLGGDQLSAAAPAGVVASCQGVPSSLFVNNISTPSQESRATSVPPAR